MSLNISATIESATGHTDPDALCGPALPALQLDAGVHETGPAGSCPSSSLALAYNFVKVWTLHITVETFLGNLFKPCFFGFSAIIIKHKSTI